MNNSTNQFTMLEWIILEIEGELVSFTRINHPCLRDNGIDTQVVRKTESVTQNISNQRVMFNSPFYRTYFGFNSGCSYFEATHIMASILVSHIIVVNILVLILVSYSLVAHIMASITVSKSLTKTLLCHP